MALLCMTRPLSGSTVASTVDAHHREIVVYPKVYGGLVARNKKNGENANLLDAQPKPVEEALAELQARVRGELEAMPYGGLTKVAAKLGVDPGRVTLWKQGKENPLNYLPLLPAALGVSAEWLLTGAEPKKPRPVGEADLVLEEIRKLANREIQPRTATAPGDDPGMQENLKEAAPKVFVDPAPPASVPARQKAEGR